MSGLDGILELTDYLKEKKKKNVKNVSFEDPSTHPTNKPSPYNSLVVVGVVVAALVVVVVVVDGFVVAALIVVGMVSSGERPGNDIKINNYVKIEKSGQITFKKHK